MDYEDPPDGVDFSKWTIPQLKTFLKARGARRTGKKADLLTLKITSSAYFSTLNYAFVVFATPIT